MLRERDVENVIYNLRILKFMQKTLLKKRQRDIVQYFMRYLIEDDEICERAVAPRAKTANELIENLNPIEDIYDRRILFEMTSRRVEAEDYQDDTSFEEDTNNLEGYELARRRSFLYDILRRTTRGSSVPQSRIDDSDEEREESNDATLMSIPPPYRLLAEVNNSIIN